MSLQTEISVKENQNSFTVYDCTGKYSGDNKTGYGTPNQKLSDIVSSTLYIQSPYDTTEYPNKLDVTGVLPNELELGYEILPAQIIGQKDEIESGLWKFKLVTVINRKTGGTDTKTAYLSSVFTKSIECCLDKHSPLDAEAFSNAKQRKVIELSTLMTDVQWQIEKGFYDQANKTIEYLKSQCKCSGC